MENEHVLAGLVQKRGQTAGEITATRERLVHLVKDLEALDSTIHQFDPSYKVEDIKPKAFRPPKDWSNRGEMAKTCLDILRRAAEPLTSRDVAVEMITRRGFDPEDSVLLRQMSKRCYVALKHQRDRGLVESVQSHTGLYITWKVATR